jgi:hypothetical protein
MGDRNKNSKGGKDPRRSARHTGKTCGRPFKAPRPVKQAETNIVRVTETLLQDSEVQIITETANGRDMERRQDAEPHRIPCVKGIKLMSDREATECARHGEVLRWSSDSDKEEMTDTREDRTIKSVGSTPDIFKSPETIEGRVPGSITSDTTSGFRFQERITQSRNKYKGVRVVPETEAQERSSDREDNVPVATLLRPKSSSTLTLQQIEECKVGPVGGKAVGKTVAKIFDGVEFRGIVDRFRTERKRFVYHVTYTDGDEEEFSQVELRDGYVLGLSVEIEAQWQTYKLGNKETSGEEVTQDSEDEGSDVEGSTYDTSSEDEVFPNNKKRIRKENATSSNKKTKPQKMPDLSRVVMPKPGGKSVTAEAFDINLRQLMFINPFIHLVTKSGSIDL